jgi:hypothetical protein
VVDVQVCAQDVVDVLDLEASLGEVLHVGAVQHMEARLAGTLLVVADAGVDQDGVVPRPQHPAVDRGHDAVDLRVVVGRRQPGQVRLDVLGRPIGQQHVGLEAMAQALLDAPHLDVADIEHRASPMVQLSSDYLVGALPPQPERAGFGAAK